MTKASKKKKVVTEERYHGPLITDGVTLGYIKFYPWIILPISLFLYFGGGYEDNIGIIKVIFLTCVIINIVSILFGRFNSLINRFKSLTYILIALVSWTVWVCPTFIALLMFITNDEDPISARTVYDSDLSLFYVIPILLLFIFLSLYVVSMLGITYLKIKGKFGRLTSGRHTVLKQRVRRKNCCSILV